LGQLETNAHQLKHANKTVYDGSHQFFEETASRERFKSDNFRELELDFSTDMSVRKAAARLNRLRREDGGIIPTTFRNNVESEGTAIQREKERLATEALLANGFNSEAELIQPDQITKNEPQYVNSEIVQKAAESRNIKHFEATDYESPECAINISIDDVCVKRQSEMRPKDESKEQPKRVNNTIIHIQYGDRKCILNAQSVPAAIKLLIGFLLNSFLLSKQLVFFTDGARDIHSWIVKLFSFTNYKIILDWYHLRKKCQEQLSMILSGSKVRNEFLDKLLPCLWFGNVSGAIKMLQELDSKQIRNQVLLIKLIEYLERVRNYIPNYALRKELGLRNSSNLGEKSNDILVASRQKHNGMSWSNAGSLAFATVAAANYNDELRQYVYNGSVSLELPLAA
jgi:hypothetical protein